MFIQLRCFSKTDSLFQYFVRNKILLVILFYFFVQGLKAQEKATVTPELNNIIRPSVEVASLGNYGNFDKNLSTGQLGLNIPIYVLEGRTLKYALSISYNGAGIQVNDRSTSVGLNWSALGAGVITRTVIGTPDDQAFGVSGYNLAYQYGDEFKNKSLHTPKDFNDHILLTAAGGIDMEPDIFSFSFNGRSGKFYYNPATDQYYTMPYSKLLITKNTEPGSSKFQVIDEKGYVYTFDKSADTHNNFSSANGASETAMDYTSQWYLTKVSDPEGNTEFSFEYVSDKLVTERIGDSERVSYLYSTEGNNCGIGNNSPVMNQSTTTRFFNSTLRQGLLLSKISCPLESVSFFYKDRLDDSKRLDSLSFSVNGVQKNYWRFYQSYYAGANKLKLDSIGQYAEGKKNVGYNFTYDAGGIPEINSRSQDHWGYYNGARNGSSLVPKIWYGAQYLGSADREPVLNSARAGILTKVQYPTGGTSDFNYELNDYGSSTYPSNLQRMPIFKYTGKSVRRFYSEESGGTSVESFTLNQDAVISFNSYRDNCDFKGDCTPEPCSTSIKLTGNNRTWSLNGPSRKSQNSTIYLQPGTYTVSVTVGELKECGIVSFSYPEVAGYSYKIPSGGLRIKDVTNYDPVTKQSSVRKFKYEDRKDPQRSSGTVLTKPEYIYTTTTMTSNCAGQLPTCGYVQVNKVITSNSNVDLFFSDGSPIGYSRVVESIGENGEGGSIEHLFSYENDEVTAGLPFPVATPKSWRKGLPLQTSYLTVSGDTISKEVNEYYYEPERNYHIMTGYKTGYLKYCPHFLNYIQINIAPMSYISEWFYLKKNTKYTYGSANRLAVKTDTEYSYDNALHLFPTKVSVLNSEGKTLTTLNSYPDEMVARGVNEPYQEMVKRNIISLVIEQEQQVDGVAQTKSMTDYSRNWPANALMIRPKTVRSQYKSESPEVRMNYNAYDQRGNLLNASQEKGSQVSYLWSYNKKYLVAEVKNATYAEVETAMGGAAAVETFSNYNHPDADMFLDKLRAALPKAHILTYTYDPGVGLKTSTDVKGQKTYYEYDSFQRLKSVKDQDGYLLKTNEYHYKP